MIFFEIDNPSRAWRREVQDNYQPTQNTESESGDYSNEAELIENVYDKDKSFYQSIKIHLITIVLFIRDDQNILYIGILLIFLSLILYLVNITTS